MDETKKKDVYSRNEKIVRVICIIAIAISLIIGILLFPLGKIIAGIIVLCTSSASAFLLSGFFVRKYKGWFATNKNKRFIYATLYALILVLSLCTAFITSYYTSFDAEEMEISAREHTVNAVKTAHPNVDGEIETILFDFFESGDGYYFSYEANFNLKEIGGAILRKSIVKYVKVNKYTAEVSFIDFLECERARSYAD